ncbi:6422_t:CDS:2 [Entrophospora sp. SA101]|nr:6422_t:CDS:2 [Entrophospora sp. SA101]
MVYCMNLFDYNKFIECLDSLEDGNGTDSDEAIKEMEIDEIPMKSYK